MLTISKKYVILYKEEYYNWEKWVIKLNLPIEVKELFAVLRNANYEAYVVGGCVRDSLLGKTPKDWDICTNATPDVVMDLFSKYHVIPTGLQHGTVTVMVNKQGFEITTYRVDGDYSDGRHPNSVSFTRNLAMDLERRDFTINAMAYSDEEGIVDIFNGVEDLKKGIIRCVGNAENRFNEDALRIMRAMRFASVLGFKIEYDTKCKMQELYPNLSKISKERINAEFSKLICGVGKVEICREYAEILGFIIPDLSTLFGFEQNNPYHNLDVWGHTLEVLNNIKSNDLCLNLAAIFHDIGKPYCYSEQNGIGHFYGHPEISADKTEIILRDLKYSNDIISEVTTLVKYHNIDIHNTKKYIRKMYTLMPKDMLYKLVELKEADDKGKVKCKQLNGLLNLRYFKSMLNDFNEETECFSLKQLCLDGSDLKKLGIKAGPIMGVILKDVLDRVINEELPNQSEDLKKYVREVYCIE